MISGLLMLLLACTGGGEPEPPATTTEGAAKATRSKARGGRKGPAEPASYSGIAYDNDRQMAEGPNVLVVVWDTVRADRTSVHGYDKPTTPITAAWAEKDGRIYDRAVSPGVWTLPSHASLFTGLPVRAHGVNADSKWLEDDHETFAEAYYKAGWSTYAFVANPYMSIKETNLLQGYAVIEHPWSPSWKNKARAHLERKLLPDDASSNVSPKWRGPGGPSRNKYVYKEVGPLAADALFRWIDQRGPVERDRPWMAFLNYMEAHLPRVPSQEARDRVMTPEAQARALTVEQSTTTFHEYMVGTRDYDALDLEAISSLYDATLVDLDAAMGDLLERLDGRGLLDDTIIVLTSDHGENLGDHGLMLHKYTVHSSLSRVPLVVSWKGHTTAEHIDTPTSVADVMLEVSRMAGVALPEAIVARTAAASQPKDAAVTEFTAVAKGSLERLAKNHPGKNLDHFATTYQAIEQGPLKLIEGSDGSAALFHVIEDPAEATDRKTTDPLPTKALHGALEAWNDTTRPALSATSREEASDPEFKEALEALGYIE